MENKVHSESELSSIFSLFFDQMPIEYDIINSSRGDEDFRESISVRLANGETFVLKLASNAFTFPEKINAWKRCVEEYRRLGYYAPVIIGDKTGHFPLVMYKGHRCVAHVEEYSKYPVASSWEEAVRERSHVLGEALLMTAKVAGAKFDFTDFPSGYSLFEVFDPSDKTDEVMENALRWKELVKKLPNDVAGQVSEIWNRWLENRTLLESMYATLPTSVFQADLNPTNLLVDADGHFVGLIDFNLCGKDVFLNYLFRELHEGDDETNLQHILHALSEASRYYTFSEEEKRAAPLLYRCLKPLWFNQIQCLNDAGDHLPSIRACLNQIEVLQTREIDFAAHMASNLPSP